MNQWNQYLLNYDYKFYREYKTTNALLLVKNLVKHVDN